VHIRCSVHTAQLPCRAAAQYRHVVSGGTPVASWGYLFQYRKLSPVMGLLLYWVPVYFPIPCSFITFNVHTLKCFLFTYSWLLITDNWQYTTALNENSWGYTPILGDRKVQTPRWQVGLFSPKDSVISLVDTIDYVGISVIIVYMVGSSGVRSLTWST